jgi:hypothetical protein
MKTIKTIMITVCLSLALFSCSTPQEIAGNYIYKTECLGSELDGSITVKAWGNGGNYRDACEQAMKNAVMDVLFKGIIEGKGGCSPRPLVLELNAREKYANYFNKFFADRGEYRRYVSLKDERAADRRDRDRKGARQSVTHGIVLRVLCADLKKKLIKDGIIKQ